MYKQLNRTLIIFLFILFGFSCSKPDLKINEIVLCDNFNSDGTCKEPLQNNHLYQINFPLSKNINTWEKMANYMYFTTRQTPGLIIKFNRNFTVKEKKSIHDTFKATYNFKDSIGYMEGLEIGENFIGVFNYLGAMVKKRQKELKQENSYPYPTVVFPAKLIFFYHAENFKGNTEMTVDIKLNYIP